MTNVTKLKSKEPTDHRWEQCEPVGDNMAFKYVSPAEQRIKDLESGQAEITPDEQSAIRKLFMDKMGIKDVDAINKAVAADNERIQRKIDNKNRF